MHGALSSFRYWLNSNILVSSDGIIKLQKSFFHIRFCAIQVVFRSKEIKAIQTIKMMENLFSPSYTYL